MKKINNILYNAGFYLVFSLGVLLVLTSVLWLLNVPMSVFHLPVSLLIAALVLVKMENKEMIISFLIGIIVIIISVLLAGYIYDQSDDGNSYHKETIGMITDGWNPIWDDYEKFALKNDFKSKHELWAEHYPKTTWIIGSSIYKITNNIETAKFYNFLILFIGVTILLKDLFLIVKNKYLAFIISLIAVFNPIMMSQILSFYLDGFMGILLFIIVIEMYLYIVEDNDYRLYFSLGSALILIINCKFTGLAYAGIFCLGYYLYYLYFKIKNGEYKNIKHSVIYFGVIVLVGVVVVGSGSYIKNIIDHKVPFYPLMGEDKVDIMTYLQPESFAKMSPIKKNFYSIFSKTANIGVFNHGEPVLKKPFTYDINELNQISYDTRIGGYGVYFSGILIISLLIILVSIINLLLKRKYKKILYISIPLIIIVLLLFFLSDGWWARYAPYLYLIVIIAVILLASSRNKICLLLCIILSSLIFINSYKCFDAIYVKDMVNSDMSRKNLEKLKGSDVDIYLTGDRFTGIFYNLRDYHIRYKITNNMKKMQRLYGAVVYYK